MHKIPIKSPTTVSTRRAQSLDSDLASEILRVCQETPEVAACNVLDFQKPDTGATGMLIVLTLDDPQLIETVAPQFIQMLQRFPSEMHAGKIFVASSQTVDVSRFAGAEFYVRQASPVPGKMVQPPVDLNKPVENPALSMALDAFVGNRGPETEQELFRQLQSAVFLVPLAEGIKMTPGAEPGTGTIEAGSLIKIIDCTDSNGANHLPLFTDWLAIQAWTDQKVSTLVMPASHAWSFVLSQPHYAGVFVNPGSQRLHLSKEFVQYLHDSK